MLGLVLAATVLSPWRMRFAVDARLLHERLSPEASQTADDVERPWVISAAFIYQDLQTKNLYREELMAKLSAALGAVTVVQTLFWLLALGLD